MCATISLVQINNVNNNKRLGFSNTDRADHAAVPSPHPPLVCCLVILACCGWLPDTQNSDSGSQDHSQATSDCCLHSTRLFIVPLSAPRSKGPGRHLLHHHITGSLQLHLRECVYHSTWKHLLHLYKCRWSHRKCLHWTQFEPESNFFVPANDPMCHHSSVHIHLLPH